MVLDELVKRAWIQSACVGFITLQLAILNYCIISGKRQTVWFILFWSWLLIRVG